MIEGSVLALPALAVAAWVAFDGARASRPARRLLVDVALVAYGAAVLALTLFPVPVDPELIEAGRRVDRFENNGVPFRTITRAFARGIDRSQIVGNVLLSVPLGVLLPLRSSALRSLAPVVAAAVVLSVAIEGAQLALSSLLGYTYRVADIDDVILNVAGAALGYLAWRLVARTVRAAGETS